MERIDRIRFSSRNALLVDPKCRTVPIFLAFDPNTNSDRNGFRGLYSQLKSRVSRLLVVHIHRQRIIFNFMYMQAVETIVRIAKKN